MERERCEPLKRTLRRMPARVLKALHNTLRGFQPERIPPERPLELIAQNSQPGRSLENVKRAG